MVVLEVCCFIFTVTLPMCNTLCLDVLALTEKDVYLENNLLGVTKESSITDCAASCATSIECESFGFEPSDHWFHLHSLSENPLSQLIDLPGWCHGSINIWPRELLGPCASVQCPRGESCSIHRLLNTPYCRPATLNLPVGMCSVPPSILNADVSSGSQQVGSQRTCTCHHGYLDLTFDVTNDTTTCLEGPYVRFREDASSTLIYHPIPTEILHQLKGNTSSLVYLTKMCRDSNFALYNGSNHTDASNNGGLYELILGGWANSRQVLRPCIGCANFVSRHDEDGILSCSEFRPLWISWLGGVIRVGKGSIVEQEMFLETPSQVPFNIQNVALSPYRHNPGDWLFLIQAE